MKKEWILPFACVLLPILLALPSSCTSDKLPEPSLDFCDSLGLNTLTWDAEINVIVQNSCASETGCHGSGSSLGDYTDYSGLLPFLDNGKVQAEVVLERTMPPNYAQTSTLTEEERDMLQCWLGNGHPEN